MGLVYSYFLAFGLGAVALWVLRRVAFQIALVDRPGGHKNHQGEVPVIGGLAMFLAFCVSALTLPVPLGQWRAFFAGATVLVVVGVLDDLRQLSCRARFGAQALAGLLMCLWGGVCLKDLGAIGWGGLLLDLGWLSAPFTVFATVGVINALNMSDGMDGLAASVSLVSVSALTAIAALSGQSAGIIPITGLIIAVVVAFLLFNLRFPWRRGALVFMGDGGSMFLGFALVWLFVSYSQGTDRLITPVTALWLFAVPLIDTVSIMLRRIMRGRSPFCADCEHLHHVFLLAGFSVAQTLGIIVLISIACAAVGVAGQYFGWSETALLWAFLALFALHFWGMLRAWKLKRFLSRHLGPYRESAPVAEAEVP